MAVEKTDTKAHNRMDTRSTMSKTPICESTRTIRQGCLAQPCLTLPGKATGAMLLQHGAGMDELWPASQYDKEDVAFGCPIPLPQVTAPGSRGSKMPSSPVPQPPRVHSPASKLMSSDLHHAQSGRAKEMGGTHAKASTGPVVPFQSIPARPS